MARRNLNDLVAFVTVAREGSFTRAAKVLGVTQSALSQTLRAPRGPSGYPTANADYPQRRADVGGRAPDERDRHRLEEIEAELDALTALRDKPAGTVANHMRDQVLRDTIWPKLVPLLKEYPDIHVEFDVSYGLRDIVADRFDAGVRLGEQVQKDMIAVPIGPKIRMAAVASPAYFAKHSPPRTPGDLTGIVASRNGRCQAASMRGNLSVAVASWRSASRDRSS